jgi:hypothetical protein
MIAVERRDDRNWLCCTTRLIFWPPWNLMPRPSGLRWCVVISVIIQTTKILLNFAISEVFKFSLWAFAAKVLEIRPFVMPFCPSACKKSRQAILIFTKFYDGKFVKIFPSQSKFGYNLTITDTLPKDLLASLRASAATDVSNRTCRQKITRASCLNQAVFDPNVSGTTTLGVRFPI